MGEDGQASRDGSVAAGAEGIEPLRLGLVGYGLGGRVFHASLYPAAPVELVAVASSDAAKVHADHPRARVHADPAALIADEAVELVVLASPTPTHVPLMLAAIAAGKHVMSDKPFAPSVAEADRVIAAAAAAGVIVTCYQNRRRDADFLTLKRLIEDGALGEITRYRAHFDGWSVPRDRWQERDVPGVGVHYDLGAHLFDQTLQLFGMPDWIQGDLRRVRPNGTAFDDFHATMGKGELRIEVSAGLAVADHRLRYLVHGTRGSWRKSHMDPQEPQLRHEGLAVTDSRYGVEPAAHHGTLTEIIDGKPVSRTVVSERGDWPSLYADLAHAIRRGEPPPVLATESRDAIGLIEALIESAEGGRRVALGT